MSCTVKGRRASALSQAGCQCFPSGARSTCPANPGGPRCVNDTHTERRLAQGSLHLPSPGGGRLCCSVLSSVHGNLNTQVAVPEDPVPFRGCLHLGHRGRGLSQEEPVSALGKIWFNTISQPVGMLA